MVKRRGDTHTRDLFEVGEVFPIAEAPLPRAMDFNAHLSQVIARALRECELDRFVIAGRMGEMLHEEISKNMLDAYASPGRLDHNITVSRLIALVRVTGQAWVWSEVLRDENITVLFGQEAVLAELGLAEARRRENEQKNKALTARIKQLREMSPTSLQYRGGTNRDVV